MHSGLLDKISGATWAAYAMCRCNRLRQSDWPSAQKVFAHAKSLPGADPWATLVLTRGELPSRESLRDLVPVFDRSAHWTRPEVIVPTAEALYATALREDYLCAWLHDP